MKKKLIQFGFIVMICPSFINYKISNPENDKIIWSNDRKLIWDDFKGSVPEKKEPFTVAETCANVEIQYYLMDNKEVLSYKVENCFIKSKSWTITKSAQILEHEQLHFDITEVYARKIRRSFDSLALKNNKNVDVYDEIYNSNISKCVNYQDIYDKKVIGNNKNQQEWIKKIGAELVKLKKYEYIPND